MAPIINGVANGRDSASDSAGNVVAAGGTQNHGTSSDFTVVKLDELSGQELWRRFTNKYNHEFLGLGQRGRRGLYRERFYSHQALA